MTSDKPPITIKKYANRRLYNTGTSAYVTLEDLAAMVKHGEDFVVYDAKTGEDITRAVLGQIIFEQESKSGQSLLPITFLRQLIRFYGSSMQMLVPSYLEFSLDKLTSDKSGFAEKCATVFGTSPAFAAARPMFGQIEEQTRQNMAMFRQALSMFPTFGATTAPTGTTTASTPQSASGADPAAPPEPVAQAPGPAPVAVPTQSDELAEMKRQLETLQRRIEGFASKG